jgi:hypothetical protein
VLTSLRMLNRVYICKRKDQQNQNSVNIVYTPTAMRDKAL